MRPEIAPHREYAGLNARDTAPVSLFPGVDPEREWPSDPFAAWLEWAERLRVPSGRLRGRQFEIPGWQREFLAAVFDPAVSEAWLSTARKNGKTGIIAALVLGFLDPSSPLCHATWRGLVVSLTGKLAAELRMQVEEIAAASGIRGVIGRRSPAPGRIISTTGAKLDILAADKASGHAVGADLSIIDEAGLLAENQRPLWNAVRSSVSGRDGTVVGISVLGDSDMFREALASAGEPGVHVQRYEAPRDCAVDDPAAWEAANPGLGTIKSRDYMAHAASRAKRIPAEAPGFRSLDLNQPLRPELEMLVDPDEGKEAVELVPERLPERSGRAWLGIDLGGSTSLTSAVAIWDTGRMEAWVAAPGAPDLLTRGRRDGAGDLYLRAAQDGDLWTLGDRVVDRRAFLTRVLPELPPDIIVGADRFGKSDLLDVLDGMEWRPEIVWRGMGASATADGSHDVRAFQAAIATSSFSIRKHLMMRLGLSHAAIRRDGAGNPALDKRKHSGRIDVVSAAVIAAGLRASDRRGRSTVQGWRIA